MKQFKQLCERGEEGYFSVLRDSIENGGRIPYARIPIRRRPGITINMVLYNDATQAPKPVKVIMYPVFQQKLRELVEKLQALSLIISAKQIFHFDITKDSEIQFWEEDNFLQWQRALFCVTQNNNNEYNFFVICDDKENVFSNNETLKISDYISLT